MRKLECKNGKNTSTSGKVYEDNFLKKYIDYNQITCFKKGQGVAEDEKHMVKSGILSFSAKWM